jgi:hypothetical protein
LSRIHIVSVYFISILEAVEFIFKIIRFILL